MSTRFKTLMLREWMQHHRGWMILMLTPPLLMLVLIALPFTQVQTGPVPPVIVLVATCVLTAVIVTGIAAVAVTLQASGLARRDQQDRSIEFWLSLPTSHSASIGATVLVHLLLVPLAALVVGTVFALPMALAVVARVFGPGEWVNMPWGVILSAGAVAFVRAALGVVLACFWLLPMLLLTMATSAWLKRWGVAALVPVLVVGNLLLVKVYHLTFLQQLVQSLFREAGHAFVNFPPADAGPHDTAAMIDALGGVPGWALHDGLVSLGALAQPLALFVVVFSAACFALLVLRRRRNG